MKQGSQWVGGEPQTPHVLFSHGGLNKGGVVFEEHLLETNAKVN